MRGREGGDRSDEITTRERGQAKRERGMEHESTGVREGWVHRSTGALQREKRKRKENEEREFELNRPEREGEMRSLQV